ncbi:hypothetical protein B0J12DRAFT_37083 [Macrophomina phaseolina]|uniref:Uncharacterized protein n=1 Tax=Macrophomina phaseolina TaxID=35725 RepID=A0ABQ8GW37_9PEZI|nr:hypothetical protein B0J12DRAFT_37083 [Macrophomina phaseolina]
MCTELVMPCIICIAPEQEVHLRGWPSAHACDRGDDQRPYEQLDTAKPRRAQQELSCHSAKVIVPRSGYSATLHFACCGLRKQARCSRGAGQLHRNTRLSRRPTPRSELIQELLGSPWTPISDTPNYLVHPALSRIGPTRTPTLNVATETVLRTAKPSPDPPASSVGLDQRGAQAHSRRWPAIVHGCRRRAGHRFSVECRPNLYTAFRREEKKKRKLEENSDRNAWRAHVP